LNAALRPCVAQKFYETKQFKKGVKAADTILKAYPLNGGDADALAPPARAFAGSICR
jgi:hypothetical protein